MLFFLRSSQWVYLDVLSRCVRSDGKPGSASKLLLKKYAANSKYAFLGSLRSTAAMISYELVLSSAILVILLVTTTLNITAIVQFQESIWLIIPLLPVFIFFFLSVLAETSRTPFDLQEAEKRFGFFV